MKIFEGSYGIVYFNDKYAIKKFKNGGIHAFYVELFYLSILQNYSNICKIVDINFQEKTITMDKYEGNLHDLALILNEEDRINISKRLIHQIYPILNILHSRGINHSDITPRNIFYKKLNEEYQFFLGDFSRASVNNREKTYFPENFGENFIYIDPDQDSTNIDSDLWCFGVTLYQFISNNFENTILDINKINDIYLYNSLKQFLNKTGRERKAIVISNPFFDLNNRNQTYYVRNMENTGLSSKICNNIFNIAMNNEHFDDKNVLQINVNISGIKMIHALK